LLNLKPFQIRTKLVLPTTALLAVISLGIYLYFPSIMRDEIMSGLIDKTNVIADMSAISIGTALDQQDKAQVENALQIIKANKDLVYFVLIDREGDVFTAFNLELAKEVEELFAAGESKISEDGSLYLIQTSVLANDREVGILYLGVSLESIHKDIKRTQRRFALLSIVIFLEGLILVLGISMVVTVPLGKIVVAAERISSGDLSSRADVSTQDEVGRLASSFNTMVDVLETTQDELESVNQNLEKIVSERTRELRQEIEVRKHAQKELKTRETILQAVSNASEQFLQSKRFRVSFEDVIKKFREVTDVCEINLYKNIAETQIAGLHLISISDKAKCKNRHNSLGEIDWKNGEFKHWESAFRKGEVISTKKGDRNSGELLEKVFGKEIASILSIPVFVGSDWWGIINFIDCQSNRSWSGGKIDALRAGVSVLGAAIFRQRSEEELLESEIRYGTLFEDSRDAVYISTPDGKFLDVNQSTLELFGYSREEMIGMDSAQCYVSQEDNNDFQSVIEKSGAVRDYEIQMLKNDGTSMDCLVTSSMRRVQKGGVFGHQGMIRNITRYKELEEQVRQMQKMEAVGRLAGGIAHDFNNIIMAIMGNVDLAISYAGSDSKIEKRLQIVQQSAERASELTAQLLAFGRRRIEKPQPVNINNVVDEVVMLIRRTVDKVYSFQVNSEPNLWTSMVDSGQMTQVLMNLLVNSCDALIDGGQIQINTENIEVSPEDITMRMDAQPGNYVRLSVCDEGSGITPEDIPRIFEPFFTTKEQGKGTGLGLAMVYGIVKAHNGWVSVDSNPKAGTNVSVYLPKVDIEANIEPSVDAHEIPGGNETILVVDDEETLRELGQHMLERLGYQVLTAADGISALQILDIYRKEIDLIILDISMPIMSGRKVLTEILKHNPAQKVIIATGFRGDGPEGQLLKMGARGFIEKPYRMHELLKTIRVVLEQSESV